MAKFRRFTVIGVYEDEDYIEIYDVTLDKIIEVELIPPVVNEFKRIGFEVNELLFRTFVSDNIKKTFRLDDQERNLS